MIRIDYFKFSNRMRELGGDLKKSGRRVIKEIADEIVEEAVARVEKHSVTGDMAQEIYEAQYTGWSRVVMFGEAIHLDEGSVPHTIPIKDAIIMAKHYGIHPDHFANSIKKKGTKACPFIDESRMIVENRVDDIIRREINRIG